MTDHHNIHAPTIVIPYRDRQTHLDCLLSRLGNFPVIVVEQQDQLLFNRGALLNIGFEQATSQGAGRVILHDCDLVPDDTLLRMYTEEWPMPIVHFGARFRRYNNSSKYFGGVHGFTASSFPGYPNHFWGWGGEDDVLRKRVNLRKCTYPRTGEYLDLEGYYTARDKLNHTPHKLRCQDKYEKIRADDMTQDNHRKGYPYTNITWTNRGKVQWGNVLFSDGSREV